jgi:hypothetical protein
MTGINIYNPLKPVVLDNKIKSFLKMNGPSEGMHTKMQWWDLHGQMICRE